MVSLNEVTSKFDRENFVTLAKEMTFTEYLEDCLKNPRNIRTAHQRIYDAIISKGTSTFNRYRKKYTRYHFFDRSDYPVYGIEDTIQKFVEFIKGAAGLYGTEKRVLLLHGPVGSAKSTILRALKRGIEEYSKTQEGAFYTFKWINLPEDINKQKVERSAMMEEPLKLLPADIVNPVRQDFLAKLNAIYQEQAAENGWEPYPLVCEGDLNPRCQLFMNELLKKYDGDINAVLENHIKVYRICYSENNRIGIGTFQPKDEKNQDATELNGDINFQKIGEYGSDSDPRAFNFDGELQISNRGFIEFIEMLKLNVEFLYDLLHISQEHNIKPKKFPQICVDEMVVGHTNLPDMERLAGDKFMEALKDRTTRIDVPYNIRWSDEVKIFEKDYGPGKLRQHVMPHTISMVALFSVLTRLEPDKGNSINLVQKAKLYDGKMIEGWTEDRVRELLDAHPDEGMKKGISPRFIQDKLSNCLASLPKYVNWFKVVKEIEEGLRKSPTVTDQEVVAQYIFCLELAKREMDDVLKKDVQQAMLADGDAPRRLLTNYLDNIVAYVANNKVENKVTGKMEPPDEKFMRRIEEKIPVAANKAEDFRRQVVSSIGALHHNKQQFDYNSNPQLKEAIDKTLFEDVRHHIKISSISSQVEVADPDAKKRIDEIKHRMVKNLGYTEESATDVLDYVSTIFARGDVQE